MKLLRYGPARHERPGGPIPRGAIRDLSGVIPDIAGSALLPEGLETLRRLNVTSLPLVGGTPRLGPCVGHVGKFICVGLNYSDHAAESGMAVPKEPIIFMKAILPSAALTTTSSYRAERRRPIGKLNLVL